MLLKVKIQIIHNYDIIEYEDMEVIVEYENCSFDKIDIKKLKSIILKEINNNNFLISDFNIKK